MQKSIEERTGYSSRNQGQYRVITAMEIAADQVGSDLPEVYQPCKGTWSEFKGDVSKFFLKLRAEYVDRIDNVKEFFATKFNRNSSTRPIQR